MTIGEIIKWVVIVALVVFVLDYFVLGVPWDTPRQPTYEDVRPGT